MRVLQLEIKIPALHISGNFKHLLTFFPVTEMKAKWYSALGKCSWAFLHRDTSLNPEPSAQDKLFLAFATSPAKWNTLSSDILIHHPTQQGIWWKCPAFHKPPLYFKRMNVQEIRVTLIWILMWMCVSKQKLFQLSAFLGQMYLLSCKRSTVSPNIKKWWEFKFQHNRNNLPPEQQATATSTWQE